MEEQFGYCIKYKHNVYLNSCVMRREEFLNCKKCKGVTKPVLNYLTNYLTNENPQLSDIIKMEKPSKKCFVENCNERHYGRTFCKKHYDDWYLTVGMCAHFNIKMSRGACYQRKNCIIKGQGAERNKYCIKCNCKEWKEQK